MNSLAKGISILFHPLFMPLFGLFILFNSDLYIAYVLSDTLKNITYTVVFFNTCLTPMAMVYMLVKKGGLSGLEMEKQEERGVPFFMISILYFITYFLFIQFALPEFISSLILGGGISLVLLFIINFKLKISAHMAGIGGLFGMVIGLSQFYLPEPSIYIYISLFIGGLVGGARLLLKSHTPKEIYVGFLVGFVSLYLLFLPF